MIQYDEIASKIHSLGAVQVADAIRNGKLSIRAATIFMALDIDVGWAVRDIANLINPWDGQSRAERTKWVRKTLLELEASGWVRKLDTTKPISWVRTVKFGYEAA